MHHTIKILFILDGLNAVNKYYLTDTAYQDFNAAVRLLDGGMLGYGSRLDLMHSDYTVHALYISSEPLTTLQRQTIIGAALDVLDCEGIITMHETNTSILLTVNNIDAIRRMEISFLEPDEDAPQRETWRYN